MTRVLLLTTGGTIASRRGDQGLEPQISARGLLEYMSDLRAHYHIDARDILNLDSSNIQAEEWQTIARAVMENLDAYDGIVITHGTDTMAYTASVLSYMLQNLTKPVVLTGSQMPIDNLLTDARNNLYTAFSAVDCRIPGVSIAFDHKLIRGCRAVKVRTMGFEAFESVNAPYLGEVFANGIHRNESAIRPGDPSRPTRLLDRLVPRRLSAQADPRHQPGGLLHADGHALPGHRPGDLRRRRDALSPPEPAGPAWRAHCPRGVGGGVQPVPL